VKRSNATVAGCLLSVASVKLPNALLYYVGHTHCRWWCPSPVEKLFVGEAVGASKPSVSVVLVTRRETDPPRLCSEGKEDGRKVSLSSKNWS
jgi:hypothetical protein